MSITNVLNTISAAIDASTDDREIKALVMAAGALESYTVGTMTGPQRVAHARSNAVSVAQKGRAKVDALRSQRRAPKA